MTTTTSVDTKVCAGCGQEKPLEQFYRRRDNPDGYARKCLTCGSKNGSREDAARRRAARVAGDPDYAAKVKAYSRDYRRRVRSEMYNVDVEALEAEQGGRCKVCRRTPEEVGHRGRSGEVLHVDHDHSCCPSADQGERSCGQCVRGLLCRECNSILGLVDDDIDRLMSLVAYLMESR